MQKLQFITRTIQVLLLVLFPLLSNGQWINEIHYDDSGGDSNEGVEIAAASGTDLSCFELIPYNGNGGASYSITSLSGIIPDEGCGFGAIWFPISGLQNGAPDGIALYNTCTSSIIEFLSYEGSFTATNGNASGSTSTDIGVSEAGSTTGSSLQLIGSGSTSSDFTWQAEGPASSEGLLNTGQSISPCGATNTITTGVVATSPFNVDCTNSTTDSGTVAFTSSGTFTAGNIYSAEISDETGSFASPTVIGTITSAANSGLINITIPSTFVSGSGYLIRITSDSPSTIGTSSAAFTINQIDPCVPNSITTGAITGAPFTVDCSGTDDTGSIAFTSLGVYTAGNIYSAEMSDASGSFASPTVIGTLASTANSGSISITIPAATATGAGYLIRIVSDSPVTTGSSSSTFTITQAGTCGPALPGSEGLIINEWSNGPTGSQEYYEFVVAGQCGTTVDIRGYILDDNNGTFTTPADYSGTASGIAPGHFRFSNAGQWASIPVGSLIVIYNNDDINPDLPAADPTDANNDSLYVVPHDNALFERCLSFPTSSSPDSVYVPCTYSTSPLNGWGALSLRNGGDAIQVRFPDGSYYHGVSYGGSEISGGPHNLKQFTGGGGGMVGWFNSGDFFDVANWSSGSTTGNQTPGLPNNSANYAWLLAMRDPLAATCPIVVLPVEISSFSGKKLYETNVLRWTTESERNSMNFELQRSNDGKTWETVHTAVAGGNSSIALSYSHVDYNFPLLVNYYRLKQNDIDGVSNIHPKIVVIDNSEQNKVQLVKIVNILGQEIKADTKGLQIHIYDDGTSVKTFK